MKRNRKPADIKVDGGWPEVNRKKRNPEKGEWW
jgi:hypothetical protein